MPRVSVIIPTWERGQWLGRALDSVYAQTAQDFEVIVVDDGSVTDAAARIVESRGDSRARYVRLPKHSGVAAARNAGIINATGHYVAFLDDDDEWVPEKLSMQVSALEKADAAVGAAYSARFSIDTTSGRVWTTRFQTAFRPEGPNVVTTSSMLVKHECFARVGLFDEAFEAGSDYDMWIRLGLQFGLLYIDVPLVKYYMHTGSLSFDYRKKRRAAELLLEKHFATFARDRRMLALQYASLGLLCCRDGSLAAGARASWQSIRLCPFELSMYLHAVRALLRTRLIKSTAPGSRIRSPRADSG